MGRAVLHERAWATYQRLLTNGVPTDAAIAHVVQRFGFFPTRPLPSPLPVLTEAYGELPGTERVFRDVIV